MKLKLKGILNGEFWQETLSGFLRLLLYNWVYALLVLCFAGLGYALRQWFLKAIAKSVTVPVWLLLASVAVVLLAGIAVRKWKLTKTKRWRKYRHDTFFGVDWYWEWNSAKEGRIRDISCVCPDSGCRGRIILEPSKLICEACGLDLWTTATVRSLKAQRFCPQCSAKALPLVDKCWNCGLHFGSLERLARWSRLLTMRRMVLPMRMKLAFTCPECKGPVEPSTLRCEECNQCWPLREYAAKESAQLNERVAALIEQKVRQEGWGPPGFTARLVPTVSGGFSK